MIQIREIESFRKIRPFIELPYRLYRNEKNWIPPLRKLEYKQFNPGANPALEHVEYRLWVAEKDGRVAGRIGCFINELETRIRGHKQARFNWLEFEDDPAICRALLDTALEWAKTQGATLIKGPQGLSNFEGSGLTIEGFGETGTMGAAFHFPYYKEYIEQAGFSKLTDYVEYVVEQVPDEVPEKLLRLQPIIEKKYGIRQVHIGKRAELRKRVSELVHLILDTYKGLSSFVPLSEKQIDKYIDDYLLFLTPDYMPLLEDPDGNIVGYGVLIPSFSRALIRAKGRLFPFGFLHLFFARKSHRVVDCILIGVQEKWRNKGLNAIIFGQTIPMLNRNGVNKVFINPILEDNQASMALFQDYNPRIFRRRRVYWKEIEALPQ